MCSTQMKPLYFLNVSDKTFTFKRKKNDDDPPPDAASKLNSTKYFVFYYSL